jgi:hypothetical protein
MKVTRDQLVALGKLLSTSDKATVDTVDVAGETVQAKDALDAFHEAQQADAAPQGKVAHTIASLQSKAESAQEKLMRNSVTRYIVNHIKPVEDVVDHEMVKLHFHDGTEKDVDLPMVDTRFNRAMHSVNLGSGIAGFVPYVGMLGFAGTAVGSAIAAGSAKLSGNDDRARALWHNAETNVFRLVGSAIPVAGNLVDAMVVAQENQARTALHAATVGDVAHATPAATPAAAPAAAPA